MSVIIHVRWNDVTKQQYEALRNAVDWENDTPEGMLSHVSAFDDKGIRVTDIWETAENFQSFVGERLMPVSQEVGIEGQPEVEILPVYAIFELAYEEDEA